MGKGHEYQLRRSVDFVTTTLSGVGPLPSVTPTTPHTGTQGSTDVLCLHTGVCKELHYRHNERSDLHCTVRESEHFFFFFF